MRAEVAYRDLNALPPSQRPLAVARAALARAFDAALHEHWLRGDAAYSNCAVARAVGVDEKTVRQWRDGEKPIPAAALSLLPGVLHDQVLAEISRMRGRARKRAVVMLREVVTGLRAELAHEDAREVRRAIHDAQRELLELADELAEAT